MCTIFTNYLQKNSSDSILNTSKNFNSRNMQASTKRYVSIQVHIEIDIGLTGPKIEHIFCYFRVRIPGKKIYLTCFIFDDI